MIQEFQGDHRFLSNFWPTLVCFDGEVYPTAEHAYQAAKCRNKTDCTKIRDARTPAQAKRFGRLVPIRADWESIKEEVMETVVQEKFRANSFLQQKLLETKDQELIEGNWWGDRYWGVCRGMGKNRLGIILMRVRSRFLKEVS